MHSAYVIPTRMQNCYADRKPEISIIGIRFKIISGETLKFGTNVGVEIFSQFISRKPSIQLQPITTA
jgi:hypothetical protein